MCRVLAHEGIMQVLLVWCWTSRGRAVHLGDPYWLEVMALGTNFPEACWISTHVDVFGFAASLS